MSNTEIWDKFETTDPKFTKAFKKGFSGTSINPTYVIKKLTEQFGPCGVGWGDEIIESLFNEGVWLNEKDRGVVHTIILKLWYMEDIPEMEGPVKEKRSVIGVGTTAFVYKDKNGLHTDEEYFKKTMTDALTNAAKKLGMSADIFMGKYDDNKYVEKIKKLFGDFPKRSIVAKQLLECETIEQYLVEYNKFLNKYSPEAFNLPSGKRKSNETWTDLFTMAYNRLKGVPPVNANETPEDILQADFDRMIDGPGDDWIVYTQCSDLIENNQILDNQTNIDKLLSLESELTERIGPR